MSGTEIRSSFFSNKGASSLQKSKAKENSGRNMTIKVVRGLEELDRLLDLVLFCCLMLTNLFISGCILYCAQNRGSEAFGCCCCSKLP